MRNTDIVTDQCRGQMSDMLLYTDHPSLPIHAALFSNFDGTYSVVVSSRNGQNCDSAYTVSLAGSSAMEIVLRPATTGTPADNLTFEDSGNQITGIRFEVAATATRPS